MKINILIAVLFFSIGWALAYYIQEPKVVTITEEKIVSNTIEKKVEDLSCKQAKDELQCYYTDYPELEIKFLSEDTFLISAALCERKWYKYADIRIPSKKYRNMIISGVFIDSGMNSGVYTHYYRMFGRVGAGGGLAISPEYVQLNIGASFLW